MPIAILKSKLYPPPKRSVLVARPRLIEQLNAGWGCKLTLVSAPAGFGKTTLVAEWVKASGRHLGWLQLDRGDNDPARFLAYLVAAVQQIREGIGSSILPSLEASQFSIPHAPPEEVLSSLVNEFAEINTPFAVVLDDYHAIEEPAVQEVINFIIQHKPTTMHLVISTRSDPPWPLARMRAFGEINELRAVDLRFTPAEAATFLNQEMKLNLPIEAVVALDERTEGWIAGLQMAALAMQGRGDINSFIDAFTGSNRFISDFLLEEVLARQQPQIQEFLLRTSILDRICAPLASLLVEPNGEEPQTSEKVISACQVILETLDHTNLFLTPLDNERSWYRYHYLFQDLLKSSLESIHPGLAPQLHRKASIWLGEQSLFEDAVPHAFASGDMAWTAQLIENAVEQLDVENKHLLVSRWINDLPESVLETHPWLCATLAWGQFWLGQRDRVEASLRFTEAAIEKNLARQAVGTSGAFTDKAILHIQGHIAATRAHLALTSEDIPRVLEQGEKALSLLPENDDMREETGVALGGAYWALGDVVRSAQSFARARADALSCNFLTKAVPASCYLAMQQAKQGKLQDALASYQDGLRLSTSPDGMEYPMAGFPNSRLGDLLREFNQLDHARYHLERAVPQCIQLGQADVLADSYTCLARYQITVGDFSGARESLRQADKVVSHIKVDPFVVCWLDECHLRLWLSQGNLASAVQWAESSGIRAEGELSYHYDLHHINLARVLVMRGLAEGNQVVLQSALNLLERLEAAAAKAGWVLEQIRILILKAQVLARNITLAGTHRSQYALETLGQALGLAAPGGFVRIFLDEGHLLEKLLEEWLADPAVKDPSLLAYSERLLNAFRREKSPPVPQPHPAREVNTLVEPLSEREMQVLRFLETGLTSTEIAARLYLSSHTVRTHIKNIYSKLQVSRRMEAVQKAKNLGLLKA